MFKHTIRQERKGTLNANYHFMNALVQSSYIPVMSPQAQRDQEQSCHVARAVKVIQTGNGAHYAASTERWTRQTSTYAARVIYSAILHSQ